MKPVNLLPERYRPRSAGASDSKRAHVVLGSLAALVLAMLLYAVTANQVSSRTAEIEETRTLVAAAEARAAADSAFSSFVAVKEGRLAAVRAMATSRLDWERLFRELAHVMPNGAWLTGFDGAIASDGTGAATGEGTGPQIMLTGCAESHSRVADAMVRLREVHDAEDVQLTQTSPPAEEKETAPAGADDGAASGPEGCGSNYGFNITVTMALPTPVLPGAEGPGDAVPARLGGGE